MVVKVSPRWNEANKRGQSSVKSWDTPNSEVRKMGGE